MHIQGNQETRPQTGQEQEHQRKSIYYHSAVPIKKRRFPVIRPPSPEEKVLDSVDNESKKQDSQIPDEKESKNNQESPIDTRDTSSSAKTSDSMANKEVSPSQVESGQATVDNSVSEPQGTKPATGINPVADFRNETDNISPKENKYLEPEVLKSSTGPQTAIVKQDITCQPGIPMGSMRAELPSGQKESFVFPDSEHKKPIAICPGPEKLDPSMLSLTLTEEKPAKLKISDCTTVGGVGTTRSNWDLNMSMEDWEGGSSRSDSLFAHTFADIGGSVKTSSYHNEKSSLTTAENIGRSLNKEEQHLNKSDSSNSTIQLGPPCKVDNSLGLRLDVPHRQHLSSSGNFITSASPNLGLQSVQMPATYINRAVKSEPVDESTRRDCSVGSSSGSSSNISNMVSLRLGSLKTEPFNNLSLETVLKSPLDPDRLVSHSGSVKTEVHQESCASSSSSLTVPLMPRNNLELSIPIKELQLRPYNADHKPKLARVDEAAADNDEKRDALTELNKEVSFESDCGSRDNSAVGNSVDIRESIRGKEDEDIEEGEVREPVQHLAIEEGVLRNPEKLEYVGRVSENLQGSSNEDFYVKENLLRIDLKKQSSNISSKANSEDGNNNHSQNVLLEVGVGEKTLVSITPEKQLSLSGREYIEGTLVKDISSDRQTNMDSGIVGFDPEIGATADANNPVQETYPVENISTLSNTVEASLSGHDSARDSGNKSRIIDISRASVVSSPCKMRSIPNRLMITRSGKERYSDLDGEIQSWGNREGNYSAGSNKFSKDRVNDESFRNSRPNFMRGRGRMPNRFNSFRSNEWDSDHDFSSGNSYGPSNYRSIRHKNTSGVETECNGYGNNNRRKTNNDEFRRSSLRRLSPGDNADRDGPSNRGNKNNPNLRRFHRNMSPNGDRFMRNLSDDMNSVYSHPQAMYDEPDLQFDRGNRNFSMQRKGYPRICSKSPIRSRTRSPGPWSSPRRRSSPNGLQDLPQHRSPGFYRRMRSPDRECFRDDIIHKRRGSSYGNNDLQSRNFRRGSGRAFSRNNRRSEELDSREMEEGDEYMNNGQLQSNKFHSERRGPGPVRMFRSSYNCGDGENFRFHMNDGARPYRFCPDADEFVERDGNNTREREFDERIKHQPMGPSRRSRNVEEMQEGDYERVWHDEGFGDDSGKKRRV